MSVAIYLNQTNKPDVCCALVPFQNPEQCVFSLYDYNYVYRKGDLEDMFDACKTNKRGIGHLHVVTKKQKV